jgi:hypothetical protein
MGPLKERGANAKNHCLVAKGGVSFSFCYLPHFSHPSPRDVGSQVPLHCRPFVPLPHFTTIAMHRLFPIPNGIVPFDIVVAGAFHNPPPAQPSRV